MQSLNEKLSLLKNDLSNLKINSDDFNGGIIEYTIYTISRLDNKIYSLSGSADIIITDLALKQNTITSFTDLSANRLTITSEPTDVSHATTKSYVDASLNLKQNILTAGTNITISGDIISATGDVTIDDLALKQNTITSFTDLSANRLTITSEPTDVSHATTKSYVDASLNLKQNILTAGTNITILGDIISATGDVTIDDLALKQNTITSLTELSVNTLAISNTNLILTNKFFYQLGQDIDGTRIGGNAGRSVSINAAGNIVAIGAPRQQTSPFSSSGQIQVYKYNDVSWVQLGQDIFGQMTEEFFGTSLSINNSGNIVAIGAPTNNREGKIRIYQYNDISWVQLGEDIVGKNTANIAGTSVSINATGNIVIIGAPGGNYAQVYQYNDISWVQLGQDIEGIIAGDAAGRAVSINAAGDIVVIGSPGNDTFVRNSGQISVYQYNDISWVQLGQDIFGKIDSVNLGSSLSMNAAGSIIAIGTLVGNYVQIYQYNDISWVQLGEDLNGQYAGDNFGASVSINALGDIVAIGSPANDPAGISNAGNTQIYKYNGISWVNLSEDIEGEGNDDRHGTSVSINAVGDIVVIGAINNDPGGISNAGYTRVFSSSRSNLIDILNMKQNAITSLTDLSSNSLTITSEPTDISHVTSRSYVDNLFSTSAKLNTTNTFSQIQTFENIVANKFLTDNKGQSLVYGEYSNTWYCNTGETEASGIINQTLNLITTPNQVLYLSAGTFGLGIQLTEKYSLSIICPLGGSKPSANGMTSIGGSLDIIDCSNIRIEGLNIGTGKTEISGNALGHKFSNCRFRNTNIKGGVLISQDPGEIHFVDCEFIAGSSITIEDGFKGFIYFTGCDFNSSVFNFTKSSQNGIFLLNCREFNGNLTSSTIEAHGFNGSTIGNAVFAPAGCYVTKTTPTLNTELTSKLYVDASLNLKYNTTTATSALALKQNTITSSTDLSVNSLTITSEPTDVSHATTKSYVDASLNLKQNILTPGTNITIAGNTISAGSGSSIGPTTDLSVNSLTITSEPTNVSHATTKSYVDASLNLKQNILTAGTNITISGDIISAGSLSTFIGFRVETDSEKSLTVNEGSPIPFNSKTNLFCYDTENKFDTLTHKYTINKSGYWFIHVSLFITTSPTENQRRMTLVVVRNKQTYNPIVTGQYAAHSENMTSILALYVNDIIYAAPSLNSLSIFASDDNCFFNGYYISPI